MNCDKTKEICARILIPYKRSNNLVLQHEEWLVGGIGTIFAVDWGTLNALVQGAT